MIFVDTNVFMYAVGRPHRRRDEARAFFRDMVGTGAGLVTSAEVLQELLHAYLPVGRTETLDHAWRLAEGTSAIWPVGHEDVVAARALASVHPSLDARDLLHLACCRRRRVTELHTYDGRLRAAWTG